MDNRLRQWQKYYLGLILSCLLFPAVGGAVPDLESYQIEAQRTFQSIEVDGDLTESDWQNAEPITELIQVEPHEGEPATQPTEVRILYDDKNLYVGFTCFDSELEKLVANEMRRDARNLHENDNVFLLLDTYNDRRSGVFFRINALGAMQDSAVTNNGDSLNRNWDAVWSCRSKINDTYWTTEIAIPFSQLRFNKSDNMSWGMNLGRSLARNQEESTWVPASKSYGGMAKYRTGNLGTLNGLKGIAPSRNFELLPYVLPGVSRTEDSGDKTEGIFDLGLDAKYGITSNLTADITFNTDFAQVEADDEQVNLTRFSLFFPEKRPFFLEGAGLFDFGIPRTSFRRPPPLLLFYSRRIGIEEGEAVPIIAGGKVTGKVGPYGVGLLNVTTDKLRIDSSATVPQTNYSVFRLKRDLLKGSSVGLIAVNKQDADTYNRAAGLDFAYRPTENLDILGMWARTFDADVSGGTDALYFGSRWRSDVFRLSGSFMEIDENFNPAVGFVRQQGVRRFQGEMRYTPWPNRFNIRRIWVGPEFDVVLNQNNDLETRRLSFINWFEFSSGGWLSFQAQNTLERLDEAFEPRDGFVIPVGEYNFSSFRTSISSSDTGIIGGRVSLNVGEFFNGNRWGFGIDTSIKPNGRFSIEPEYQFNRVTLPAGSFNANLFGARVNYSFSTLLFAKVFAQWNSASEVVSTNMLLNYIYRPGSDFYLVFNQTFGREGQRTELIDSAVVAKMTYWWNP